MSQNTPTEKTFSAYNKEQGKAYSQGRPDYHPKFYQYVTDIHASTGGQFDTLLDVGSGPGNAARALSPHFAHAIGLDPSEGMVATARSLAGTTATSEPIRFEVSTAELLGTSLPSPIQDGSVDLITAANAAHWFDMSQFWSTAARVLKPGGSVIMWTTGKTGIDPSVPNADAINSAMDELEETLLKPFMAPGNFLTRNRYLDLPLPWNLDHPVTEFDEKAFIRKEWGTENFLAHQPEVSLDVMEKVFQTMSPVVRWREAYPDTVGTEDDIVKIYRRTIERLLHEAGVEKGKEIIKGSMQAVVLVVKKRSS
ncbi:hypothetical protein N7520_007063 [Penicillium odoratum]|uniref:uncharacterized protein n=1 Tax=Penicillium odoratum TaxID=1167516 RepID=UPI002546BBAF|nr:uncharacterized protein N7520_007063 [Penicillium odoratum]KAJ5759907.1 hypothetical protein N7520_007063 [Penicillium odoratum]